MRKCPKCKVEIMKYSDILLHPVNGCNVDDGVEITVAYEKTQEAFKIMTIEKSLPAVPTNSLYTRVSKYLKRILHKE